MKSWNRKEAVDELYRKAMDRLSDVAEKPGAIAFGLIAVGAVIWLVGNAYLQYISQRIYDDSTAHLTEIYGQVNSSFNFFLERNWGNLDDWDHYLRLEEEDGVQALLKGRQECWGFSDFYFLAEDGSYLTSAGESGQLALENVRDLLFADGERVMSREVTPIGQTVTVFSIPVERRSYRGFEYSAIAISYTNADIIHSLRVDAYAGASVCLVIDTQGQVLLSTSESGSAFGNYIAYLRASGLTEGELAALGRDWEEGKSGVISCKIGGVDSYLSYQDVGYLNYVLLGIVPESVASASLRLIQQKTINVLVKAFALVVAIGILWVLISYRRKTKRSAAELKYRDFMFDILSNTVDDIFLMLDAGTYHVDFLSSNVGRLLGIPHEEAVRNIGLLGESAVGWDDDRDKEIFRGIELHGSRQWEREHMHHGTGERRWYRETVYRETIQGMEKYLIVMSDRTKENETKQRLQIAYDDAKSANEAKSHFLSNMSHDIRTPMNAIIGFSVLLAKDADNPEKVREYTRKISASGSHLLSLINDVLDMSKIESGKTSLNVSEFSLPEMLEELYMILLPQAKAKKHNFEMRIEGRMPEQIKGDKLRLNQILINMLSNAIKYTQAGGQIDFVIEDQPEKSSEQYACLRFKVKDNGCGMSEEFLKTVFSPFTREVNTTTSGIQGTGLGMAITKSLVDLMGGTIEVESELGEGSIFTVELSFARSVYEEDEEFWGRRGISRVLVADDEEMICLDVQESMRETGVDVTYATDGYAAVEAAVRAKEEGEAFHVILLDWKMPGMNGVETARKIREKVCGDIPILVLTSYDWGDIEDEARAAGIDAFMPKPFFVSSFRHTIEMLYPQNPPQEMPVLEENVLAGMRFLVAEDNELNAEILSELLSIEDAGCERAENGQEALEMFRKSEPGYYDMILMDVQMPVMNGYEATRAIRNCAHPEAKTVPIVAMTANAFAEDVHNALEAGMNGHLAKPVDMDTVKAVISRLREDGSGEQN